MNTPITLEEEQKDAIYLLSLLERRYPAHLNSSETDLDDVMEAQDELDEIVKRMELNFHDYCKENNLQPDESSYINYVSSEAFNHRQNRLLQCIELYHALTITSQFSNENPNHILSQKFTKIASSEDTSLLRQYIAYDIQTVEESITEELGEHEVKVRLKMVMKCKKELEKTQGTASEKDAKSMDFSIDTLMAYTLATIGDELEFKTAIAVKSQIDETSEAYLNAKEHLVGLIQHIGGMSEALTQSTTETPKLKITQRLM